MGQSIQFRDQLEFNYTLTRVDSLTAAMEIDEKDKFDVALLDLSLTDSRGLKTLEKFLSKEGYLGCPTIVLTGYEDEKTGFEALQKGAVDYLNKGKINSYLLVKSILYACIRKDNQALLKAKEVAENTAEMKQRFLASMSHELRTPLNVVIGTASLLEQSEHTQQQQKYIDALKITSQSLLGLINNILDVSKIESGKIELENKPFELTKVLEDLMQLYSFKSKDKKLGLYKKFDLSLPNYVIGDSLRLNQVLINLLDNAMKFTESGGEVELKAKVIDETEDTSTICFQITDSGIGIAPEKLESIFDSFVQADESTTRLYGGTGLGLSISQHLVGLFGGQLSVESEYGKGATFGFTIDLIRDKETVFIPIEEKVELSSVRANDDYTKILLVEDHDFNQMIAIQLLKNWSNKIEVDIAHNGKEGVEKVTKNYYDLVLMDIAMPEMDGLTATKMIRTTLPDNKKNIPIIAMTAHALKTEMEKCFAAGMNDFISKPIDQSLLFKKINKVLNLAEEEKKGGIPKPAEPSAINELSGLKVDLVYFDHLACGDPDLKMTLIKSVLDDLPIELEKIKVAYSEENVEEFYKVAHKLKSTFGYVGLKESPAINKVLVRPTEREEKFYFEFVDFEHFKVISKEVLSQINDIYFKENKSI